MHEQGTSIVTARRRAIRVWLLVVAALMVVTVVVGGATRLTESGLSIVEWKPVTGVLPPLDEQAWQVEFDKYKAIPQYRERNAGMSLADFKTIYWWEWTHRVLARLVGAVFLLPLLWFLWRGQVEPHLRARLLTIFFLGAALGAVGWWMVASGLSDRVSVSQYRLAFHLTLACVIFAAVLWTAQNLVPRAPVAAPAPHPRECAGAARSRDRADLSRRAGLRPARRPDLQYLAADRRQPGARRRAPVLPGAGVAQCVREHADGAVRSPHGGLCAVAVRAVARRRRRAHAARRRASSRPRSRWRRPLPCRPCSASSRCSTRRRLRSRCCIRPWRSWCSRSRSCMRSASSGGPRRVAEVTGSAGMRRREQAT